MATAGMATPAGGAVGVIHVVAGRIVPPRAVAVVAAVAGAVIRGVVAPVEEVEQAAEAGSATAPRVVLTAGVVLTEGVAVTTGIGIGACKQVAQAAAAASP